MADGKSVDRKSEIERHSNATVELLRCLKTIWTSIHDPIMLSISGSSLDKAVQRLPGLMLEVQNNRLTVQPATNNMVKVGCLEGATAHDIVRTWAWETMTKTAYLRSVLNGDPNNNDLVKARRAVASLLLNYQSPPPRSGDWESLIPIIQQEANSTYSYWARVEQTDAEQGNHSLTDEAEIDGGGGQPGQSPSKTRPIKSNPWHRAEECPPEGFEQSLAGTQKDLSEWIIRSSDYRAIGNKLRQSDELWGRKLQGRRYEVFFKDQRRYAEANKRKLDSGAGPT